MVPEAQRAGADLMREVERVVSSHLGMRWHVVAVVDLQDRASYPAAVLHGDGLSVFVKCSAAADARALAAEIRGLQLLHERAGVLTPGLIGDGVVEVGGGALLVLEAMVERTSRTDGDWRAIGRTLATLHQVQADDFGLAAFDGWFGPLPQDNRPVLGGTWAGFFAARRVLPRLRSALASGHLPVELGAQIERLAERLPELCGPEPRPSLLHGDAQQNNFLSTPSGAVVIDASPSFGHPEVDLALLDYFAPVGATLFEGYEEALPIDPGFADRRELWRIPAYLAVVEVDGGSAFGQGILRRLVAAVQTYQRGCWHLDPQPDGTLRWTSPAGRTYTTRPRDHRRPEQGPRPHREDGRATVTPGRCALDISVHPCDCTDIKGGNPCRSTTITRSTPRGSGPPGTA